MSIDFINVINRNGYKGGGHELGKVVEVMARAVQRIAANTTGFNRIVIAVTSVTIVAFVAFVA